MNKRIANAKIELNGTEPKFFAYGNFTVCVIEYKEGKYHIGVTKRNCNCDDPNPERAKTIAYERALKGESVRL